MYTYKCIYMYNYTFTLRLSLPPPLSSVMVANTNTVETFLSALQDGEYDAPVPKTKVCSVCVCVHMLQKQYLLESSAIFTYIEHIYTEADNQILVCPSEFSYH